MASALDELRGFDVSLIADGLDACGRTEQVLPPRISMVSPPTGGSFAGVAKTLCYRVRAPEERFPKVPSELVIASLKKREQFVGAGDVVVMACQGGEPPLCGLMGNLYATLYRNLGVAAVVTDGYVRDLDEIVRLELPVVAAGTCPTNAVGRIAQVASGEPVTLLGVAVRSGDFLVGDRDGCVVVPSDAALLGQLLDWLRSARAQEKSTSEFVLAGGKLSEAFERFGRL